MGRPALHAWGIPAGLSFSSVGSQNLSSNIAPHCCILLGVDGPNTPTIMARHPDTLTTRARILELRALGLTYTQIAAEVGLSRSRVGQIVKSAETRALIQAIRYESSDKKATSY